MSNFRSPYKSPKRRSPFCIPETVGFVPETPDMDTQAETVVTKTTSPVQDPQGQSVERSTPNTPKKLVVPSPNQAGMPSAKTTPFKWKRTIPEEDSSPGLWGYKVRPKKKTGR